MTVKNSAAPLDPSQPLLTRVLIGLIEPVAEHVGQARPDAL